MCRATKALEGKVCVREDGKVVECKTSGSVAVGKREAAIARSLGAFELANQCGGTGGP